MSDWEFSDKDCPKCGEQLAERRCDNLGCDNGQVDEDDDYRTSETCTECNGTGWQEWCRSCGFDVTNNQFLQPKYEAEWRAKQSDERTKSRA